MIRGTGIDSTVKLYLKGNGANGSTKIYDDSQSHKTTTAYGNAEISTDHSEFGGSSIYLDGTGDYLTYTYTIPKTGDISVSCWIYPTNLAAANPVFSFGLDEASGGYKSLAAVITDASKIVVLYSESFSTWTNGTTYTQAHTTIVNQWTYWSIVRSGTNLSLYIDGSLIYTWTGVGTLYDYGTTCHIGYNSDNFPQYFNGYIDDFIVQEIAIDGTIVPTRQRG